MIVDELITLLGFEVDKNGEQQAGRFKEIVSKIGDAALVAGAAVAAFAGAVAVYAGKQAEAVDTAGKFADSIGITYERLQELEYAAQRSGGTVDELRSDLDKLTKSMSSPVPGEYNQTLFQLGINARDSTGKLRGADDILTDIAARLEGMDKQRQAQFAEKLGLSPSSLKLIQNGKAGIAALTKQARDYGLVLEENSKKVAADFQDSLLNTKLTVDGLGKSIAIGLLPGMGKALDRFTGWIGRNREFIATGITQVVNGVGKAFDWLADGIGYVAEQAAKLLPDMGEAKDGLDATRLVAIAVTAAFAAMAVAVVAAVWPFLLAAAAIAGLVLVAEDIAAALEGQPSIIGDWAAAFAKAYPGIVDGMARLWDLIKTVVAWVSEKLQPVFEAWGKIAASAFETVTGLVDDLLTAISRILSGDNVFEVLTDWWVSTGKRLVAFAATYARAVWDAIKKILGSDDPFGDLLDWFGKQVAAITEAAGALVDEIGKTISDWVSSAWDGLANWFGEQTSAVAAAAVALINDLTKTITDWAGAAWDGLADSFAAIGDEIGAMAGRIVASITGMFTKAFDEIFAGVGDLAKKATDKVTGFFGGLFGGDETPAPTPAPAQTQRPTETVESIKRSLSQTPVGSNVPVSPQVMSSGGGGMQDNRQTTITINGAGDPASVGREVVRQGGLGQTLQTSRPGAIAPTVS